MVLPKIKPNLCSRATIGPHLKRMCAKIDRFKYYCLHYRDYAISIPKKYINRVINLFRRYHLFLGGKNQEGDINHYSNFKAWLVDILVYGLLTYITLLFIYPIHYYFIPCLGIAWYLVYRLREIIKDGNW